MTCFHILIVVFEHFMDMGFYQLCSIICFAQVAILTQCIIYKTGSVSSVGFLRL